MSELLKAALDYASLNWHVVPLHTVKDGACSCGNPDCGNSRGKHPHLNDWEQHASTDPEVIKGWWGQWPDANIGIAAGKSGLLILDGDGPEATESTKGKAMPPTPTQQTPNGFQWSYQHPGFHVGNLVRFLPGLDVRSNGGQ
ncbi:MAG: bifunctional DNA primase/polymerase, partial [Planctomycetota bacterium]